MSNEMAMEMARQHGRTIEVGHEVQYSARFLRAIGVFTGDMPAWIGRVVELRPCGSLTLAVCEDVPAATDDTIKVNVNNLIRRGHLEAG